MAKLSILATMLGNYLLRQVLLTAMQTCSGWSKQPAWFWQPFTLGSLVTAAVAALLWPWLGGDLVYENLFGVPVFPENASSSGIDGLIYLTLSYILWSLALLPHTLVRVGVLVYKRCVSDRGAARSTDS